MWLQQKVDMITVFLKERNILTVTVLSASSLLEINQQELSQATKFGDYCILFHYGNNYVLLF